MSECRVVWAVDYIEVVVSASAAAVSRRAGQSVELWVVELCPVCRQRTGRSRGRRVIHNYPVGVVWLCRVRGSGKVRLEVDDEINALARRAVASRNVRFGNLARITPSGFVGRKRIEMSSDGGRVHGRNTIRHCTAPPMSPSSRS